MPDDVLKAVEELRQELRAIGARQDEALTFLRGEAEQARKVRDEAIALQRTAMVRARRIGLFAFPAILLCIFLVIYLVTKYRILF